MTHSFKTAFELIKKYSRKSVFYSYFKRLFLLITVPFLVILSGIYYYHQKAIDTEIRYSAQNTFDRASIQCTNTFQEIFNITHRYNEDIYVQWFFNTDSENFIESSKLFYSHLTRMLSLTTATSSTISRVSLYGFANNYIYSSGGGGFAQKVVTTETWYQHYKETGETSFIISGQNSDNSPSIQVVYPFSGNSIHGGLIIFDIATHNLNNLLLGGLTSDYYNFYILDEKHTPIYSSAGESLDFTEFLTSWQKSSPKPQEREGKLYFASTIDGFPRVTLIGVHNSAKAGAPTDTTSSVLFILFALLALLAPLGISLYISMKFYQSIANIITRINVTDTNNMSEMNEFSYISNHITDLMDKNRITETALVEQTAAFKQAQAHALQAQLNPHFLFNTLHLIGLHARVLLKGENPVTTMVSLLSEFLSAALDTHNYIVTVKQEHDYTEKYLEIQKVKYKNNFDIIWDVDEEILSCNTIKLILQPLIENSFQHAIPLLENGKRGAIEISAKLDDKGDINFCVKDNGPKIPSHRLTELRKKLEVEDMPKKDHIGLANVNTRIRVVYGAPYGVSIFSTEEGTSVYIKIPKE